MAALTSSILAVLLAATGPEVIRINQLQVIGTHNSYHAGLTAPAAAALRAHNPATADALDYSHPPLTTQLDGGVRQVELDVFADAKGGRFAHPLGASAPGAPSFDPQELMRRPGFKVMHVQDIDYVSTCQPFTGCLRELRAWSLAHPQHTPLFVLVETKDSTPHSALPLTKAEPIDTAALDALDAEVRSVFDTRDLITPDQVRGRHSTLEEAVLRDGWPTLAEARGKLIFLLDQQSVSPSYLAGHPVLKGRVMFTNAEAGQPDAAFIERNEGSAEEIAALVRQGYLVRTRADSETRQGRTGDVTRRDLALRSGAQIVSTDYPAAEPARWTGYSVSLPGGVSVRCDPVNAPPRCTPPPP